MDSQNFLFESHAKPDSRFSRFRRRKQSQTIKIVGGYKIGGKLGQGSNGYVYSAYRLDNDKKVAVKIIPRSSETAEKLQNQIDIISSISHPNVVQVYEIIYEQNKVFIFMQLCQKGDLFYHIKNNKKLPQPYSALIFLQIHSVLLYLHNKGITHRDIKAQNILLDEHMCPKLTDFGLAKIYNNKQNTLLQTWCGSFNYVAPEIIKRKKYKPQLIDLWSLCVTLYVMLLGREPFNRGQDRNVTKQCIVSFDWEKDRELSREALEIFDFVFVPAQHRISLKQVQNTQFYKKYQHLLQNPRNTQHRHPNLPHSNPNPKQSIQHIKLQKSKKRSHSKPHQTLLHTKLTQHLSQPIPTQNEYGHISQLLTTNAHNKIQLIRMLRQQRENKNNSHNQKFRVRRSLPKKIQYFYDL